MDGPWWHYATWQTEKDKYCMISFLCAILKKKKKEKPQHKKLNSYTQRLDGCLAASGGGGVSDMGGEAQKVQTSSYKMT